MRTLLIGTSEGIFETSLPNESSAPRLLDFDGDRFGWTRIPIVIDAEDPDIYYLATTANGVFRSEDRGRTWEEHNLGLTYKEVWTLEQHPSTGNLFAGSGPTSIARSTDGGESWEMFDGLTTASFKADWYCHVSPYHSRVRSIALNSDHPDVIVATIEEGWVVRSIDGGTSWTNPRDGVGQDGHSIAFVPGNSDVVLSATGTGIYRSTDGAETFKPVEIDSPYATQIATHPGLPHTAYAVAAKNLPRHWRTSEGAGMKVFRSDDDGETWNQLAKGWPSYVHAGSHGAACFDPADPDVFAVGMSNGSIWLTEDGNQFREVITGLPPVTSLTFSES